MQDTQNLSVAPQIRHLTEIINDISKGELRVPNFQRPYVWKEVDIIALFDSIYKGYPIGSLLFWETDQQLESMPKIGPYKIPLAKRSEVNFILDGHQRLSTLYGALKPNPNFESDKADWILYFDLEKEEFVFPSKNEIFNCLLPLNKVISTLDFLDECKRIQDENSVKANIYINRAQRLAQTIITYKLTITQIKGGDLSSAVEIFSRLNTKGLDMTPDQMLSALTYKEGSHIFKLANRIDEILEKLVEYRFSEVDRIFIFRAIIAAAKRDIYNVKLEDLAKDSKLSLSNIVDRCEESILKSVDFLFNGLNIPGDKLLPYNLQLVFLSEFFYTNPKPSLKKLEELNKWFWFTTYSGWFAGANSSKVRKGLDDMRNFAKIEDTFLTSIDYSQYAADFPDKFDFRYARIKAYVLFLLSLNPKPLELEFQMDPKSLLSDIGHKALHYILPGLNHNANRLILGPVKFGYAKRVLQDSEVYISEEVLRSHAITSDALKAIRDNDIGLFFILREEELNRLETEFMEEKGIKSNIILRRNPFSIDTQMNLFDELTNFEL